MTEQLPTVHAGKRLGRYRIVRELGRGGMGVVYLATDEHTGRDVALKATAVAGTAEKSRNQRRERFVREVRALIKVSHPNVVHVFDAGEVDDPELGWLLYYVMEYVEGWTLAQLVQSRGALPAAEAAAVIMQVAAGLGAAHAAGIVHRDVKPANVFISIDGRALIGDFGIAKLEGSTQITRRDQLVGTPNYLAPEQILGEPVTPATDVFAIGALFYIVTTMRALRPETDARSLLASAAGDDPRTRMLAAQNIPPPLRQLLARCLERNPLSRPANGTVLAEGLADHAGRVPVLSDNTPPAFLREGTADGSGTFASLPEANTSDVEELPAKEVEQPVRALSIDEAAKAMLQRVEERAQSGRNAMPTASPSLPVARAESTVMFNLRTNDPPPPPKAPKQKPASAPPRAVVPTPQVESFVSEPTPAETIDLRKGPSPSVVMPRWQSLPLWLWPLAGVAVGAVVAGGVALLTPAPVPVARKTVDAAVEAKPPPLRCRTEANETAKIRAVELVDKAREAKQRGDKPTVVVQLLQEATMRDPRNHEAFYLLAPLITGVDQQESYRCVCALAPSSRECRASQQVLDGQP